jgi:DNA polymerase III subunit epsilon
LGQKSADKDGTMREVVFDTETTGLSPASGDRLVEMGCVELVNRIETGRTYHCYYNPERTMPIEAQNVHGLSDAFLADKPLFEDRVEEFLDFIEDSPLIAHNASFDFSFVNHELAECGRLTIPRTRMVDTLALARVRHPGAKHSLDALCTRYGIDRSHRVKHGALLDAQLLSQLYVELTGGRQIGLELVAELGPLRSAIDFSEARTVSSVASRALRQPRLFAASDAEMERHQAFIAKLTDPLWHDVPSDPLPSDKGG